MSYTINALNVNRTERILWIQRNPVYCDKCSAWEIKHRKRNEKTRGTYSSNKHNASKESEYE